MLLQIIAQIALVIYLRLVQLDSFHLQLEMDIAMTKQTMFTATMMALTAADLPLLQTPARIAYVMVSLIYRNSQ